MIYTKQMRNAVHQIKPPNDFIVDVIEYELDPKNPFIGLRFYEHQWNHYSDNERLKCIEYIGKIRNILTAFGVRVTLEPVIDTGDSLPEKFRKIYKESL